MTCEDLLDHTSLIFKQATWVPIIYFFFPESKGLELEAFDRLFAGEDDGAVSGTATTRADSPSPLGDVEKKTPAVNN